MATIIPSIASADQMDLRTAIASLKNWNYLHLDIEDGNFVPNITFGLKTIRLLTAEVPQQCDVHLMTTDPLPYLHPLAKAGVCAVCFHWESSSYPALVLNTIRQYGMSAGIAFNPRTGIEEAKNYLSLCDYVLIMTSEPDARGEVFQEHMLDKVYYLRNQNYRGHIVVDGGIGEKELELVRYAGADVVIMGRAVFGEPDPGQFLRIHSDDKEQLWNMQRGV